MQGNRKRVSNKPVMKLSLDDVIELDPMLVPKSTKKNRNVTLTEQDVLKNVKPVRKNGVVTVDDLHRGSFFGHTNSDVRSDDPHFSRKSLSTGSSSNVNSGRTSNIRQSVVQAFRKRASIDENDIYEADRDNGTGSTRNSIASAPTSHVQFTFNECKDGNAEAESTDPDVIKIQKQRVRETKELETRIQDMEEHKEIENIEIKRKTRKKKHKFDKAQVELKKQNTLAKRDETLHKVDNEEDEAKLQVQQDIDAEFEEKESALEEEIQQVEDWKTELDALLGNKNDQLEEMEKEINATDDKMMSLEAKIDRLENQKTRTDTTEAADKYESKIEETKLLLKDVQDTKAELEKHKSDEVQQKEQLDIAKTAILMKEEELDAEKENIAHEKQQKYDFALGKTAKRFNMMRANILQEHIVTLKNVRERKSLIDQDEFRTTMKLEMRQKFLKHLSKEKLKMQRRAEADKAGHTLIYPEFEITPLFLGEETVRAISWGPSGEFVAAVGWNFVLHVMDSTGDSKFMISLKRKPPRHTALSKQTILLEWSGDSNWLAVLRTGCEWLGLYHTLSNSFSEFTLTSAVALSYFSWSRLSEEHVNYNSLVIGTDLGDFHICNVERYKDGGITSVYRKMTNPISLSEWSDSGNFVILTSVNRVAITTDKGRSIARVKTADAVKGVDSCCVVDDEIVVLNVGSALIIHHVSSDASDDGLRKRIVFQKEFGEIMAIQCSVNGIILVCFSKGYLTLFDLNIMRQLCCCRITADEKVSSNIQWDICTKPALDGRTFIIAAWDKNIGRVLKLTMSAEDDRCVDLESCFEMTPLNFDSKFGKWVQFKLDYTGSNVMVSTTNGHALVFKCSQ